MSDHERYGQRDMLFSRWHRSLDTSYKFLDVDWVEFCHVCSEPLAVVEIAQDVGQKWKPTTVLERLAKRSKLPAFCILYQADGTTITGARVRRVFPNGTDFKQRTADQLERLVARLHDRCCAHESVDLIRTPSEVFEVAREVELDGRDFQEIQRITEGSSW